MNALRPLPICHGLQLAAVLWIHALFSVWGMNPDRDMTGYALLEVPYNVSNWIDQLGGYEPLMVSAGNQVWVSEFDPYP